MKDFLFRGSLADLDPAVSELANLEAERQNRKLILIPSESEAPLAVREALASAFQNIYAEGYPDEETRQMQESEILDFDARLAHYRRYSDPRYYKGVEYADLVEALARRRCAEAFATDGIAPEDIFVNVQALSGAPANNAVYHALVSPGETIMGMNLLHGGHLTHGSAVNRSGKYYQAVHYTVDPQTEQINYEAIEALAQETKPKFIIAGYSSYPWAIDWARFKAIAKSVGALLFADIAHVAGLVVGGAYPSPLGYADVITFTTHKSLCGPRGACILTTDPALARKIDRAVFPGEQGGPHVNVFAAIALTFKLARTEQFRQLQHQIVANCVALTRRLEERGFRIPYGGTNTHLTNLDCSTIRGPDGTGLSGDQAARILDIAGIVVNRNTIPGDTSAVDPNGIRLGTPWVTQRGFTEPEMLQLADAIADLLQATRPFALEARKGEARRAKVDFNVLEQTRLKVRRMAEAAGSDDEITHHGAPHFYYLDDKPAGAWSAFVIRGKRAAAALNFALSSDVDSLEQGISQPTRLYTLASPVNGTLVRLGSNEFRLTIQSDQAGLATTWLRDLSDGYVAFEEREGPGSIQRKLPGPFVLQPADGQDPGGLGGEPVFSRKPFFIGITEIKPEGVPLPAFQWQDQEGPLRRTPVFEVHKQLGAKLVPFAGWEMPVRYTTTIMEEHMAVRKAAGLFDVAHMGVYQAEGPQAEIFLDSVVGNEVGGLDIGESLYTHFMDPDAEVIDDLLVYRRGRDKFLVVVNASNDDKDWAWLNAVREGRVCVDNIRPWAQGFGRGVILRNLRDPKEGADMRVDIALQGPRSRDILMALGVDTETRKRILRLKRTQLCDATVGGFDLVVSRTGYTGEKMAFELFVHPDRAAELFTALLNAGEPFGLKPCGLGARDSLRTEAGLPLYGHEMGTGSGRLRGEDLGVAEAGFGSYVKTHKPWFIGREAYLEKEARRKGEVVRFRFTEKGVRMAHNGDPVLDKRGKVVGWVTSSAADSQGYQTGQAYVELKSAEDGTQLYIFQGAGGSAPEKVGTAPSGLSLGDRATLAGLVQVVSRFPK